MKKLISFMLVIFSAFSLTGCLKNEELEENKIKAPVLESIAIDGVWEIVEQYKVTEDNKLEVVSNIENPLIKISKKEVSIQETNIDTPKFKFKRVSKEYLPKEFYSVIKGVKEEDNLMDIITISDNTNLNIDFIKQNEKKAYIYTVGKLLVVQKVTEGTKEERKIDTNNSTIANFEKKKGQDSGVLIGIKEPSTIDSDGKLKDTIYKTLWIYTEDGKIQEPKVIDGLLLPKMNGGFSDINMKNEVIKGEKIQNLNVVTQNKSGKIEENKKSPDKTYREITFIGKDYIGIQYYDDENTAGEYKIIPVDSIGNNKGLNIKTLYGDKGVENYTTSRKKFISNKDEEFLEKYDVASDDMGNISIKRKNGKWAIEGKIKSKTVGVSDAEFDVDLSATGTLVNWDSLPMTWTKINEFAKDAKDAVSSPIGDFMVILNDKNIEIYNTENLENVQKPILTYPVATGSSIVMNEWATGNEFVRTWNKVVDSKEK